MSKSTKEHEKNRKRKGYRFSICAETNRIIGHLALKRNCTRSEVITDAVNFYYLEANFLEECQQQEKGVEIFNKTIKLNISANNVNKPGK